MARHDYAVIAGIWAYPELDSLDAPENDAKAFYDWVVSPAGGAVPKAHVRLIVSSQFDPPFPSATAARPKMDQVLEAMEALQDIAEANRKKGKGYSTGRRLYLYFAGHGFAPTKDQTALLMANATRIRAGAPYHILGPYCADWFFSAGFFDEVVLFMDCCRDNYSF